MSNIISSVTEQLPLQMEQPQWVLASAAAVAGGLVLSRLKASREASVGSLPFADPDIATRIGADTDTVGKREKIMHYGAVAALGVGLLQLTNPYSLATQSRGEATIIIDSNYRADVKDMANDQTRFEAALDGAIAAAESRDVPFNFVLAGSTPNVVDSQPAEGKKLEITSTKIKNTINGVSAESGEALSGDSQGATFRNGESLGKSVATGRGISGQTVNKLIVIAANPGEASGAAEMQIVANETKGSVFAIATGTGPGNFEVGTVVLESATDTAAFAEVVGEANVQQADSAEEVQAAIEKIVDQTLTLETKTDSDWPIKGAVGIGILTLGLAVRQHLRGAFNMNNRKRRT